MDTDKTNPDLDAAAVNGNDPKIVCTINGPYLIHGATMLVKADGTEVDCDPSKVTALCACGRSNAKPYCDGSHLK